MKFFFYIRVFASRLTYPVVFCCVMIDGAILVFLTPPSLSSRMNLTEAEDFPSGLEGLLSPVIT